MSITLSICIPTLNRAEYLKQTLQHLKFIKDLEFETEIIICDGSPGEETEKNVASMSEELPLLRYFREKRSLGYEQAVISAFRAATGKYCIYLADEDRLIPERLSEHIKFIEQDNDLVACYSPWEVWDDIEKKSINQFFRLDQIHRFSSDNSLELFNLILQRHIMPETAVYRTEFFQKVLFAPRRTYWAIVWLFNILKYGHVCFHHVPFHRVSIRSELDEKNNRQPIGNTMSITYLDHYRSALEFALFSAFEQQGFPAIPGKIRANALDSINNYINSRVSVAARISRSRNDFIGANEFHIRNLLWQHKIDKNIVVGWEKQIVPRAGIQAVIELFENTINNMKTLVLCGFSAPDQILAAFRSVRPDFPVETRSDEMILTSQDRDQIMVLTEKAELREKLVKSGMLPGFVILFEEVLNNFKILPRDFRDIQA